MSNIPVKWTIKREMFMPVLEINAEGFTSELEKLLLTKSVEIIEYAKKFKGVPYKTVPKKRTKAKVEVYFSLIFPTDKECDEFVENVKKGNVFR